MALHRCQECDRPVIEVEWPDLPLLDGNTDMREANSPLLKPCGHRSFAYSTGESITYESEA